jgi:nucleotide-binding universal stress UspA family protein
MAEVRAHEAPQRSILIAVDSSQNAIDAFNFYATHIHQPENSVHVVYGAELPPVTTNEAMVMCPSTWDNLMEAEKQETQQLEKRFADLMHAHNMAGRIQALRCGRAGELIVEVAKEEGVVLIVIGSRGQGVLRRTLMGSVSQYVLHHAHCPVVVITQPHHTKHHSASTEP